ncbi:MAG: hypothetical protein K6B69_03610 [Lachnospiraceae bacterium]|nr:hypothetical protein [Lachnospiraceae bacterium]
MNFFIEGIQGAGKSTLTGRLAERLSDHKVFHEGDHNPVELAWCAYMTKEQYEAVLVKYEQIAEEIKANTITEPEYQRKDQAECGEEEIRYIVTYTRIITDIPGFHKDLEQYEIYNGRIAGEDFERIILSRYARWHGERQIFECSFFQNIVEDFILYSEIPEEKILEFYKRLKQVLSGREYKIVYLDVEDVAEGIDIIRKERVDGNGNEMWFPLMMEYLKQSPRGLHQGWKDFDDLVGHLEHRKSVELRILRDILPEHALILRSKDYDLTSITV